MSKRVDTSVIGGKLQKLGYENYADYLASDHWKDVRKRYSESDLPQWCECGRPRRALHHTTYERLGEEELTDLEPVCHDCHRKRHEVPGRKRRKRKKKDQPQPKKRAKKKRKPPYRPYRPRRARKPREEPADRRRRLAAQVLAEQECVDAQA